MNTRLINLLDAIMRTAEFDMVTYARFYPRPFLGIKHLHARTFQICYMVSGVSRIMLDGRPLVLTPGDATCIGPGQWHGPAPDAGEERVEVMQVKFVLGRRISRCGPGFVSVDARLEFESAFRGLFNEYYMRRPLRNQLARNYLMQMLLVIDRSRRAVRRAGASRARGKAMICDELKVREIMDWITRHYAEDVALTDMAAAAGMSVSALGHAFKLATGMSPIRYLLDFRLAQALALMQHTDAKLDTIAEAVGLSSANYLCRLFKKRFQRPPRRYAGRNRRPDAAH